MATGKKYYWLKLKQSFLTSEKVDYLLSQKNGASYVVIYQMLCLKTLNTNGELSTRIGEILIPFDIEKIQRDLKHFDIDTIRIALNLYKNLGMVYVQENGVIKITDFAELVGCETDYAQQKRLQRMDKGVDNVHIEYREKRIEKKSIDKHIYGEYMHVKLTDEEHKKLVDEFGEPKTEQAIKFLDEYIEEKGYKSKSHYLAMRRWVLNAVEEKKPAFKMPKYDTSKNEEISDEEYKRLLAMDDHLPVYDTSKNKTLTEEELNDLLSLRGK